MVSLFSRYSLLSVLVVFLTSAGISQTDSIAVKSRKNDVHGRLIVKADLFWPILAARWQELSFQFTIEKPLARRHSCQLSCWDVYYDYKGGNLTGVFWEEREQLFMVIPEYKFFVSKKRECSGYYIGASGFFMTDHYYSRNKYPASPGYAGSDRSYTEKYFGLGGGFINGVQFYLFKRVTVDLLAGILFFDMWDNNYYEEGGDFIPRLAFNLGYKF